MRELTSHKVNELNEALKIEVLDEPGQGNACHEYLIRRVVCDIDGDEMCVVCFQNGPISEAGVNGISNESLLAIVEDRLQGFQDGKYACRDNEIALMQVQEAMAWLHKRTRDRLARGVEGTNEK